MGVFPYYFIVYILPAGTKKKHGRQKDEFVHDVCRMIKITLRQYKAVRADCKYPCKEGAILGKRHFQTA